MTNDYLIATYPDRGLTFVAGEGNYLIDRDGNKYLDLGSNYGVSIFGYGLTNVSKALEQQLRRLINLHGSFRNDIRNTASKRLVERCGGKLSRVFFSNSGAEAIEAALKFACLATGKRHFIAMINGYHGKTLGALSATSGEKYRRPFLPLLWNFTHVNYGDLEAVQINITPETAAVIVEPVQGEGGIRLPPPEYLKSLQQLCETREVLLISDEIQSGVGRTGTFLAGEQFGINPDILCLGKGLAGGLPIGATLVTEKISQKIPVHIHTSTFGGNPLACAGIIAVLGELENGQILERVQNIGKHFLSELKQIRHREIIEARGLGLMLGLELRDSATPALKALQTERIIALPAGSNIVRFLPPYLISEKEVDQTIAILKKIFA